MDILEGFKEVFQEVFEDDELEVTKSMTANDVEGWDSLNHMILVNCIEDKFDVMFDDEEIVDFQNVGDMMSAVEAKLA